MTATLPTTTATRPTVPPTIGIDPGQRWVGLAARIDHQCLDATMLDRGPLPPPKKDRHGRIRQEERYLGEQEAVFATRLIDTIALLMRRHHDQADEASQRWQANWPEEMPWRIAVEGIVVTRYGNPAERLAKLASLVEVAFVAGGVVALNPGVVIVRPQKLGDRNHSRHGDVLARLGPYPKELSGFRPRWFLKAEGTDRIHERSAWAVAGAAQLARPLPLLLDQLARDAEGVRA